MNLEERKEVAKTLAFMGTIYSKEIKQDFLSMYLDNISDIPFAKLKYACQKYLNDPKNRSFPLPAQLRAISSPEPDNDQLAKEAAARIPQAIVKFGYTNPSRAREFIGELGWRVVERFGGWQVVCEQHGVTISPDTFYAQARDLARSTLDLGDAGIHDQPIGLGEGKSSKPFLELLTKMSEGSDIKKLTNKEFKNEIK